MSNPEDIIRKSMGETSKSSGTKYGKSACCKKGQTCPKCAPKLRKK